MSVFIKRQNDPGNNPDDPSWWYYSDTAIIIKWVICGALLLAIFLFIVGGYFHAQRRMKKGLPPLRYHRWLVPRQQRERFFPPQQQNPYVFYRPGAQAYRMQPYGPAPPAYQQEDYVPAYSPPEGASKVDPDQHRNYAPPSGPPPNHNIAGSSYLDAARTTSSIQPSREQRPLH